MSTKDQDDRAALHQARLEQAERDSAAYRKVSDDDRWLIYPAEYLAKLEAVNPHDAHQFRRMMECAGIPVLPIRGNP